MNSIDVQFEDITSNIYLMVMKIHYFTSLVHTVSAIDVVSCRM